MTPHLPRWFATSLLGLLACQGGDPPASAPGSLGTLTGTAVTLTRFGGDSVAYTSYSGVTAPLTVVIRDPVAWSELWQEIHATTIPVPLLPAVDFTQEMIVVAALGTRATGGYDILLAQAAEDASGLQVEVVETSPGPGCVTTQALTQPVDLARTPRRDGSVRFVMTQRVSRCGS
jgi:hypothetical protein